MGGVGRPTSPSNVKAKAKACLRACCQGQGHGSPRGQAVKGPGGTQPRPYLAFGFGF